MPRTVILISLLAGLLTFTSTAGAQRAEDRRTCDELRDTAMRKRHETPKEMRAAEVVLKSCVSQPECAPESRSDCEKWLSDVLEEIPTIVLDAKEQAANGTFSIVVPDSVTIDGEAITNPQVLAGDKDYEVDPGNHTFVFRRAGFPDVTVTQDLRASRASKKIAIPAVFRALPISVTFDVKERRAKGDDVAIAVDSILVDGVPVKNGNAVAGAAPYDVPPGKHTFVFMRAGSAPVSVERELTSAAGSKIVLSVRFAEKATPPSVSPPPAIEPPPDEAPSSARSWVLGSTGVVAFGGLAVGTIFGIKAISKNSDAGCDGDDFCDRPDARRDAQSAGSVSTAGFVVGGVGAAAFLATLLFWPSSSTNAPKTGVRLSPFGVRGSW